MSRRLPDGTKVRGVYKGGNAHVRMRAGSGDTEEESILRLVWSNEQLQPLPRAERSEAQSVIVGWAKQYRKHKPSGGLQRERLVGELNTMLESGTWSNARPAHLVELYCLLHEKVYGVEALDLRGQLNRQAAARMVLTMMKRDFNSLAEPMVEFMRWSWQREESREEWRRRNNTGRRRLTWRMQFGGELLTEYLMQRVNNG